MKSWLRRLRGALGTGVTWALGWAPIGALTGWLTGLALSFPLPGIVLNYTTLFGLLGFAGGTVFSGILTLTEGRKRFDELSMGRFASWGAAGGFLLGGAAVSISLLGAGLGTLGAAVIGTTTVLGAASAAGSLALARAADDSELLEGGEEVAEIGLDEEEARRLLGPTG